MNPTAWQKIRVVMTDVDGVLTDGRLYYGPDQTQVAFHIQDGRAVRLLQEAGIIVVWITGRGGPEVRRRAHDLDIELFFEKVAEKHLIVLELLQRLELEAEHACFIGDDTQDLGAMAACGTGVAVADAHPDVRAAADHILAATGGSGALREVADLILAVTR